MLLLIEILMCTYVLMRVSEYGSLVTVAVQMNTDSLQLSVNWLQHVEFFKCIT